MTALSFDRFTLAACVTDLGRADAAEVADALEFRMDGADRPLEQLAAYEADLPIIATNRAEWDGGDAPPDGRLEALETAVTHRAVAAVDVELRSVENGDAEGLRRIARENDAAVIVSWHDFERTPARDELDDRLEAATGWGDVGKLAVTPRSMDDVLDVLVATRNHTKAGRTVATLCMGEHGRHSRVIAPLYGSKIGYAPITPEEATAPGQFPLAELRRLIDRLGG